MPKRRAGEAGRMGIWEEQGRREWGEDMIESVVIYGRRKI